MIRELLYATFCNNISPSGAYNESQRQLVLVMNKMMSRQSNNSSEKNKFLEIDDTLVAIRQWSLVLY